MKDPFFEGTIILLCQFDEEGALGIVVNRECPVSIGDVLEQTQLPPVEHGQKKTLWGGPVGGGACFVMWHGPIPDGQGWTIDSTFAISPSIDQLRDLINEEIAFEIAVGYAGWGAGQLDDEIAKGSWLYSDIPIKELFSFPITARYDSVLSNMGLTRNAILMTPINE